MSKGATEFAQRDFEHQESGLSSADIPSGRRQLTSSEVRVNFSSSQGCELSMELQDLNLSGQVPTGLT
jgi:hypothetical protein